MRSHSFNFFIDRCNYEANKRSSLAAAEILGQTAPVSQSPPLAGNWLSEMAEWSIPKTEKRQI